MYLVVRSTKYSVIDVKNIERPMHLIPNFGTVIGTSVKAKNELDQTLEDM